MSSISYGQIIRRLTEIAAELDTEQLADTIGAAPLTAELTGRLTGAADAYR